MASESYLVQLLSDSNLPTGGFIASGGLESYHAHGFLPPHDTLSTTLSFVEHTLGNYAASVLPYMCAAYRLSRSYIGGHDDALDALCRLDWHHHTLLLNHVSRRASLIQGIALLTLYVRSFSSALQDDSARADALVEELRRRIRRGGARLAGGALALPSDELAGHLAVCTGVFSCCVGLSFERMIHHHVFLQARNLMSCSIRLNTIGPYLAHRLLASDLRPLVERVAASVSSTAGDKLITESGDDDDEDLDLVCTTWPLGEIIQARHDQLHSRLFNS